MALRLWTKVARVEMATLSGEASESERIEATSWRLRI